MISVRAQTCTCTIHNKLLACKMHIYTVYIHHSHNFSLEHLICMDLPVNDILYHINQWHIFITLIVSCTNTTVTPGNLNFISSAGVEVHSIPSKFQTDCSRKS